jgi:hypothetical protein
MLSGIVIRRLVVQALIWSVSDTQHNEHEHKGKTEEQGIGNVGKTAPSDL